MKKVERVSTEDDPSNMLAALAELRECVLNLNAAKTAGAGGAGRRAGSGQTNDALLDDVEPVRIGDLVYLEVNKCSRDLVVLKHESRT